ncbi:hypothetical protein NKH18_00045 [Streptomyces sp. M10(2022)]
MVAGPALAAIPLVTAVSLHTGLPAAYVRAAPKGTGRGGRSRALTWTAAAPS